MRQLAQDRVGAPARAVSMAADPNAVRSAVDALLAQPLTIDSAVEIALLNNAGLQAKLAELGLAEADLVQAGRLRNPVFAYSNKRNAEITQIERTFLVNVAALIFMPLHLEIEQRRFAQAKVAAAADIVSTAAATRQAFVRAVAAQEMLTYYAQVKLSADGVERARAPNGTGRQLEQARANARAGVLRRRHCAAMRARSYPRSPNASSSFACSDCGAAARSSRCPRACPIFLPRRSSRPMPSARRWNAGSTCRWRSSTRRL